ncbi:MAG: hypothetical protein AAB553_03545 [Patescibacteria group bacterium]
MKLLLSIIGFFFLAHIALAYVVPESILAANFPYKNLLHGSYEIGPITAFANFDGYQYLSIAHMGYGEFQQSYFPLFPLLIHSAAPLFNNQYLHAGLFVSWLCLLFGIIYFYKLTQVILVEKKKSLWAVVLLLSFPTAFFYLMVYPESFYLLLSSAALYYLYTKRYLYSSVFALFASLTKVQGVFLILPFVLAMVQTWNYRISFQSVLTFLRKHIVLLFVVLSPLYGLLLYMGYLFIQYGDPLYFYHAQAEFGANRTVNGIVLLPQVLYRYVKIFLTAQFNFQYLIAVLEFVLFVSLFTVIVYQLVKIFQSKKKNLRLLGIHGYSLAVLILPTLTGTLTSVPRYALLCFGFFLFLANLRSVWIKLGVIGVFLIIQVVLFFYFLQGYFVS